MGNKFGLLFEENLIVEPKYDEIEKMDSYENKILVRNEKKKVWINFK